MTEKHTAESRVETNGETTGVLVEGGWQGYWIAWTFDNWSGIHGCELWFRVEGYGSRNPRRSI